MAAALAAAIRSGKQVVPAGKPDQALYLAFVIALAGTAKPIRKQVTLQLSFALFAASVGRCRVSGAKVRADSVIIHTVAQSTAKKWRTSVPFILPPGVCCTCVPGVLPLLRCRSVSRCFR